MAAESEVSTIPQLRGVYYTTFANFPPANSVKAGDLAYATDLLALYRSNGVVWQAISSPARDRSWLLDQLCLDAILTAIVALVGTYQVNPATGTFSDTPARINDNNVAVIAGADGIGQYAEVDYGQPVLIRRWRHYGMAGQNNDGTFTLQYYDLALAAWTDWVTGILTRAATWSNLVTETIRLTTGIRWVVTALDTAAAENYVGETEVIY